MSWSCCADRTSQRGGYDIFIFIDKPIFYQIFIWSTFFPNILAVVSLRVPFLDVFSSADQTFLSFKHYKNVQPLPFHLVVAVLWSSYYSSFSYSEKWMLFNYFLPGKCSDLGHSLKKLYLSEKNSYIPLKMFLYLPEMNYFFQMKNFLYFPPKNKYSCKVLHLSCFWQGFWIHPPFFYVFAKCIKSFMKCLTRFWICIF